MIDRRTCNERMRCDSLLHSLQIDRRERHPLGQSCALHDLDRVEHIPSYDPHPGKHFPASPSVCQQNQSDDRTDDQNRGRQTGGEASRFLPPGMRILLPCDIFSADFHSGTTNLFRVNGRPLHQSPPPASAPKTLQALSPAPALSRSAR